MSAGKINLTIDQGADFSHTFQILDPQNVPIDLTGYTAKMQARTSFSSDVVVIDLTTENGGLDIDLATAELTISIPRPATALFTFDRLVYDILLISTADTWRLVEGQINLCRGVTR